MVKNLIDSVFSTLRHIVDAAFEELVLLIAPLFPAIMLGTSVYAYFADSRGVFVAQALGLAGAFTVEAAGYWGFKAHAHHGESRPAWAYIVSGVVITVIVEWGHPQQVTLGVLGFVLAGIIYWCVNISRSAATNDQRAAEDAEYDREQDRQDRELERQIKREQAAARVRIAEQKAARPVVNSVHNTVHSEVHIGSLSGSELVRYVANKAKNGELNPKSEPFDDVDRTIIELLTNQPRTSMKAIGEAVNMSGNAAKKRLKKIAEVG